MLVIALLGILAGLAIGFSGSWRRRGDHRKLTRETYNAVNVARAEALKRGRKVKAQFDNVNHRIVVFVDADNDNAWDAGETNILQFPAAADTLEFGVSDVYDGDMSIVTPAVVTTAHVHHTVIFDHQGFLILNDDSPVSLVNDGVDNAIQVIDAKLGATNRVEVTLAGAIAIR